MELSLQRPVRPHGAPKMGRDRLCSNLIRPVGPKVPLIQWLGIPNSSEVASAPWINTYFHQGLPGGHALRFTSSCWQSCASLINQTSFLLSPCQTTRGSVS